MAETDDEAERLRAATAAVQERLHALEQQAAALAGRLARLGVDDVGGHRALVAEQRALGNALRDMLAEAKRIAARQASLLATLKGDDDTRGSA